MMERRIANLLHAAEDAARLNDFVDAMAGEPIASSGPPIAVARQIEEHLLVALASQEAKPPVRAIEVGAAGYYYKDQLDASFVRRLNQLVQAFAMRSPTSADLARGTPGQGRS